MFSFIISSSKTKADDVMLMTSSSIFSKFPTFSLPISLFEDIYVADDLMTFESFMYVLSSIKTIFPKVTERSRHSDPWSMLKIKSFWVGHNTYQPIGGGQEKNWTIFFNLLEPSIWPKYSNHLIMIFIYHGFGSHFDICSRVIFNSSKNRCFTSEHKEVAIDA